MRFFTFSSSPVDKRIALLRRTCTHFSVPIDIIPCNHTKEKPTRFLSYTQSLPTNEIAVCVDGFDVLCLRKPLQDELCYLSDSGRILFGAERFCFHHLPQVREYSESINQKSAYRFLNGGMFAGRIGSLRSMMEELLSWNTQKIESEFTICATPGNNFNDQTLFGLYFLKHQDKVLLDCNSTTFWNVWGEYDDILTNFKPDSGAFRNPSTASHPLFLHTSQIDKYFCVYSSLATRICPTLPLSSIDIRLFRRIVKDIEREALPKNAEPDSATRNRIEKSLQYQILNFNEALHSRWKNVMFRVSKLKRSFLRILN